MEAIALGIYEQTWQELRSFFRIRLELHRVQDPFNVQTSVTALLLSIRKMQFAGLSWFSWLNFNKVNPSGDILDAIFFLPHYSYISTSAFWDCLTCLSLLCQNILEPMKSVVAQFWGQPSLPHCFSIAWDPVSWKTKLITEQESSLEWEIIEEVHAALETALLQCSSRCTMSLFRPHLRATAAFCVRVIYLCLKSDIKLLLSNSFCPHCLGPSFVTCLFQ